MKGGVLPGLAVVAILWMAGGSASRGDLITVDRIEQQQPGGVIYGANPSYIDTSSGGEFTLVAGDPTLLSFYSPSALVSDPNLGGKTGIESFCLELNVGFPSSLPVGPLSYDITPTILNDPAEQITLGTAWLYSQFAAGTLKGYNYSNPTATFTGFDWTSARAADAAALQAAIWFLQGQYPGGEANAYLYAGGSNNKFLDLLTTDTADGGLGLTNLDQALAADPGGYSVDVVNLGDPGVYQYQAQLIVDPLVSPLVPIPEASTMLVSAALAGYAGLRMFRRYRALVQV